MAGQQAEEMHLLHANSKAPVKASATGTLTKQRTYIPIICPVFTSC